MTQNVWFIAAIWAGISVALVEILVGVIAGNFLGIHATTDWINFLALLGSGVLTFLAGAEIDPRSLKANLRASGLIGIFSFGVPFVTVWIFAQFVLGWPLQQAQIAGLALSTTSVVVVYAVMIEGGYSDTAMGKTILAACFITDFRHSSRARGFVRKLQHVACRIRDRDVRRALVHAGVDAIHYCATRRDTR